MQGCFLFSHSPLHLRRRRDWRSSFGSIAWWPSPRVIWSNFVPERTYSRSLCRDSLTKRSTMAIYPSIEGFFFMSTFSTNWRTRRGNIYWFLRL